MQALIRALLLTSAYVRHRSCKRNLLGSVQIVAEMFYHPQCLSCGECNTSLVDQPLAVNKWTRKLYCVRHASMSKVQPGAGAGAGS